MEKLLFNGQRDGKPIITLLFNKHFYCLGSLTGWFGYGYYCLKCEKKYSTKHTRDPNLCHLCDSISMFVKILFYVKNVVTGSQIAM